MAIREERTLDEGATAAATIRRLTWAESAHGTEGRPVGGVNPGREPITPPQPLSLPSLGPSPVLVTDDCWRWGLVVRSDRAWCGKIRVGEGDQHRQDPWGDGGGGDMLERGMGLFRCYGTHQCLSYRAVQSAPRLDWDEHGPGPFRLTLDPKPQILSEASTTQPKHSPGLGPRTKGRSVPS